MIVVGGLVSVHVTQAAVPVVTQFQVWLIYNGPHLLRLVVSSLWTDNGKFHFTIYSITLKFIRYAK
jgi:hypothetical protein